MTKLPFKFKQDIMIKMYYKQIIPRQLHKEKRIFIVAIMTGRFY